MHARLLAASGLIAFAAAAILALSNAGCADIEQALLGEDSGTATTTADAGEATESGISYPEGGAVAEGDAAVGTNCGYEATTGVILCTGISSCPDIVVSQTTLTGCGFRIRGDALDLECGCGGELCPIGAPTTCAEAVQLLTNQTQPAVCTQISEGHCTTPGQTGSTSTTTSSSCDQTCAAKCVGAAPCLAMCGC